MPILLDTKSTMMSPKIGGEVDEVKKVSFDIDYTIKFMHYFLNKSYVHRYFVSIIKSKFLEANQPG